MAKKDKKPQVEAPVVDKPAEVVDKSTEEVQVINPAAKKGLTQGEKVTYLTEMRIRTQELAQEENPPIHMIHGYNMIRDAVILDIACGEIACGESATGYILIANETNYTALKLAANATGIALPEYKSLPRPTKAQLNAVGIAEAGEIRALPKSDIKPSKEVLKQKKAEQQLNAEAEAGKKLYLKDHTKIETDEQLKEALGFQLVNMAVANPIDRLVTTDQFYRAYLEARAEKSDNPQTELDKIHKLSLADLLQDITTMVEPTFVLSGFGKRLCMLAEDSKSIVPAFCAFKNCVVNRKTGTYKYTDEEIAAFVRVLIVWYVSAKSAEMSASIKEKEKNLLCLKKDAKANAKAIEAEEKKIAGLKSAIAHFTEMISLTSDPSFELANDFIAAYNNNDNKFHISAVAVYKAVVDTYYRNVEIDELEFDSLLLNVQQHIGIILNLFNSEMGKVDDYDEKNLIEFSSASTEQEEPKNA